MLAFGIGGPLLIIINDAFLRLWLGDGRSSGYVTTSLCVLLCAVQLFSRVDSVLLDGFGKIKFKAILQASAALLFVCLAPIAARAAGLNGLLLTLVIANTLVALVIRVQVHRHLSALSTAQEVHYHRRKVVVVGSTLIAALAWLYVLPEPISPLGLIFQGIFALVLYSVITWRCALLQADRAAFAARLKHFVIR